MHLIQPIDISGTKHCVKHGATTPKWRTVSILDSGMGLYSTEDGDRWKTLESGLGYGSFEFATCCIWKATIRFEIINPPYPPGQTMYRITLNGVVIVEEINFPYGTSYEEVIDLNALGLMGRACGNHWLIDCAFNGNVLIKDVTFGPPV